MRPDSLAAMTYTPVPETKMYRDIMRGKFHVLNEKESLMETSELIQHIELDNLHFTSSHASNFVPIDGILSRDKTKILNLLNQAIAGNVPKRNPAQRGL